MNSASPGFRAPLISATAAELVDPHGLTGRSPRVQQYLRIVLRWKYVILGIVAACLVVGLIITLLMTPQYTAVTTIEISREANKVTEIQAVERETSDADQEFYQTQYGLLRSRALAERVAAQLRIAEDPQFFAMFGVTSDTGALQITDGRYGAAGRGDRLRTAADILLRNIDIAPARLSRLVEIRFTSPDATFSSKVANAWSESFIQSTLERRYQATSYARTFLEQRLNQLRQRLEESERQLVAYASSQRIINLPAAEGGVPGGRTAERSIAADDLSSLNAALAQATANRIQAEARFRQGGGAGTSAESLRNTTINGLRQRRAELSADYQRLLTQFQPEYPAAQAIAAQVRQLDASIAREEGRVTQGVEREYREALVREQQLTSRVDGLKDGLLNLRRRSIQYNIYQRDADTNRQLYDGLLQRYKEIGISSGIGTNNISVVDRADVPTGPSSPRLLINLALALLAGLVLGALIAFVLEQADEAVAEPEEISRMLGLSLLGSVPKIVGQNVLDALLDRKSEMVDAYLAIQTNLAFVTDHGAPRSLAVTSTRPAEGKSTTALALATMLTRAHKKVILVDGDMRSPSVHHLGGVSHDHGLSNFLAGADAIAPLLFRMETLGFDAMSAGPIPPNAAELLTSDRLAILINRLLETYDHVVIDSPPVMGLADAPLIGSRVEAVVYAVESHGIRASMVRMALNRLAVANVRIAGGVLTKFEQRRSHYGYGYDYGYSYGQEAKAGA